MGKHVNRRIHQLAGGTPTTRPSPRRRRSDVEGLVACIDAAYAKYVGIVKDLPPARAGCAEDISENQVWVAVRENIIIGGLFLVPQDEFMKLANIAVHPDHSGQGIAGKLMTLSETEARNQGFKEMQLSTHVDMPENIRLYEHLGWDEFARYGNTLSMRKSL